MKALLSLLLLAAAPATVPAPAAQAPAPAAAADQGFALGIGADEAQRMTVPVSIGGKGPYRFIIDTGAERTVIARELAQSLGLGAAGEARVHSMTEVSDIATVLIPSLQVGQRQVAAIHAPALLRQNLGAEGMLGVDSLQKQRVSFDFARHAMTVVNAANREEQWASDAIVVTGKSRFGHLVLVDASLDGEKVWVIVDTGAQVTVGNRVLRARLERRHRLGPVQPIEMLSVTGGRLVADQSYARVFHLGDAEIRDLPIAFADAHPFKKLGLLDRPAILLGMDALKLFERVSVDFGNRRVRLLTPGRSETVAPSYAAALVQPQRS
ncbi:MAG: aspartyl protease family protein [Alphaproteobacteria bacterium]|nr:aspartyl protease family protein [Alphaproteobacteria bacterium]